MKKGSLIIILFFICSILNAQVSKILFLGNSYTYANDLPLTLKNLALSMGDTISYDSNCPGGHTFDQHSSNATSITKINQQAWDYVILQEQSQLPSFPPMQVASQVYPFAHKLDSMIIANDSCTETLFYMTWGRKNGDASNCPFYPPICTYDGMQQRLRDSYMEMALDNHASVSPVGVAWKNVRDNYSLINLYQPDESHPSVSGTYLAACVFYSSIFHKTSVGATFISAGVSPANALILQTIGSATVLDSIGLWQNSGDIPNAAFSAVVTSNSVQFSNNSFGATDYTWDFGDGNTDSSMDPNHTYASDGIYVVSLTASNGCKSFIHTDTVQITTTEIYTNRIQNVSVYPNPASSKITIKTEMKQFDVFVTDIRGNVVLKKYCDSAKESIDISALQSGLYFIEVSGDTRSGIPPFRIKFIVNR